jgi:hypothetical protein
MKPPFCDAGVWNNFISDLLSGEIKLLDGCRDICYISHMIRQGQKGKAPHQVNISATLALSLAGSSGRRSI